jgi:hypothetical protein
MRAIVLLLLQIVPPRVPLSPTTMEINKVLTCSSSAPLSGSKAQAHRMYLHIVCAWRRRPAADIRRLPDGTRQGRYMKTEPHLCAQKSYVGECRGGLEFRKHQSQEDIKFFCLQVKILVTLIHVMVTPQRLQIQVLDK